MSKMMVKQVQHRMFVQLVEDLEKRTPTRTALGYRGWRLSYWGIPRKQDKWQDPFIEKLGRQDNGKWRRWPSPGPLPPFKQYELFMSDTKSATSRRGTPKWVRRPV